MREKLCIFLGRLEIHQMCKIYNTKLPRALSPTPQMVSRKKSRKVTILFHILTRLRDQTKI